MSKALRVLHVVPSLGPLRGGPSFIARATTTALARTGLMVDVATIDDNGPGRLAVPLAQPLVEDGVTYWYFARQTRFYTASWPLARWLAAQVSSYDLVHIHALFSFASTAAALCAARQGVPYIVRPVGVLNRYGMTQRRPLFKQLSLALVERHILAVAAAVHFTSEQERLEATALRVPHRAVVIPNPVAVDKRVVTGNAGQFRARHPRLAERTIILFLARIDEKKGLDLLLPAFAQLRAHNSHVALVVAGVGDPSYVASLQAAAVRLDIAAHVLWVGFLAGDEKWAALADADIFVLPSYSENFGVAAVEAMACGLPVIISDQVGIAHDIAAAGAGLVTPCRAEPLAHALATLSTNPALRRAMGERGRRLADERFTPAAVAEQLRELYDSVLDLQLALGASQ